MNARLGRNGRPCELRSHKGGGTNTPGWSIMGRPMATSQDFVNWVPTEVVESRWLQLVLIAERSAMARFSKGAIHQTVYYPAWLSMHISLPPLAEQKRIVAKVNELMALCDRLEAQLTTTQTESRHLFEAVLNESLNGQRQRFQGALQI